MKQDRKALLDPLDSLADSLAQVHTLKAIELKKERDKLNDTADRVSNFSRRKVVIRNDTK
ncbi:MAG TPA: hypothetical protein VGS11_07350 [Candidatus Bathyarchaeia archaeon]|nr:hypothetical protein [Candidatus Bathyarchaeia archaeon]